MLESLVNIDETIFQIINQGMSHPFLDTILIPLRHKLFWIPLYLFLLLFISINFSSKKWLIYGSIILTILVSDTLSSKVIKPSVERLRPCHIEYLQPVTRVPCGAGYSFISSHACNHFSIATLFFFLFAFTKWRFAFLLWAAIISFAQVYVGQHFPLDVIAGAFLGMMIGGSVFFVFNYFNNNRLKNYDSTAP